jgi:hypothetical protein
VIVTGKDLATLLICHTVEAAAGTGFLQSDLRSGFGGFRRLVELWYKARRPAAINAG